MYEYKYVETSLGGFLRQATHRETIEKYAQDGWRLVQVLPTHYDSHGKPAEYEIIFERLIPSE
ncbi:DUF4177 domain-containing protein [Paenibacillus sp. GCM10023252]|uniref:DUF4177 domain-containing protein n=1 Tax=Paenibacillus sp. GCM10023252 TaxID=3252649 RepID=UPI003619121C